MRQYELYTHDSNIHTEFMDEWYSSPNESPIERTISQPIHCPVKEIRLLTPPPLPYYSKPLHTHHAFHHPSSRTQHNSSAVRRNNLQSAHRHTICVLA